MQKRDLIQANASLENLRQNLDMKDFAKEILLEENYNKFIRSYKFTFWFQLIGVLAGFIVPSVVFLLLNNYFQHAFNFMLNFFIFVCECTRFQCFFYSSKKRMPFILLYILN